MFMYSYMGQQLIDKSAQLSMKMWVSVYITHKSRINVSFKEIIFFAFSRDFIENLLKIHRANFA